MTNPLSSYQAVCRPGTGAGAFFSSILVWGVGIGCFGAAFNNFLVETYDINGFDRGVLEFLRETPGVLLVAIFAALHRFSDWKVLRFGTACSLIAAMLLLVPVRWAWAVAFIVVWALGEHLVMPVRQSLALSIAKEGKSRIPTTRTSRRSSSPTACFFAKSCSPMASNPSPRSGGTSRSRTSPILTPTSTSPCGEKVCTRKC